MDFLDITISSVVNSEINMEQQSNKRKKEMK